MKLSDIVKIRTGLVGARKLSKEKTDFLYNQINLKSINANGYINMELLDVFYATEKLDTTYLTQKGDIIVKLTQPYTAVLIDESTKGMVIPSQFAVIRYDSSDSEVLPEYLYWFLNSDMAKRVFMENNTSNVLGAIRPLFIGELKIKVLPIKEQELIANIYLESKKECMILEQLKLEKEKYSKAILKKIYNDN